MRSKASGFYADSLEMLLDTMCNFLGTIIFITLALAVITRQSTSPEAYQKQAEKLSIELAATTSSNAVAEAEIQRISLLLQTTHPGFETNLMRLPNENANSGRKRWPVIVRYGTIYPVLFVPQDPRKTPARNTTALIWQNGTVTPKSGEGVDAREGVEALARAFGRTSQTNYFLAFYVYEDSFKAFNVAKETAVQLGIQYGWKPLPENTPLEIGHPTRGILPQN